MSSQKETENSFGKFVVTRHDSSQQFVCDRCLQPKIAKVVVEWTLGQKGMKRICNGCYGRLSTGAPL